MDFFRETIKRIVHGVNDYSNEVLFTIWYCVKTYVKGDDRFAFRGGAVFENLRE